MRCFRICIQVLTLSALLPAAFAQAPANVVAGGARSQSASEAPMEFEVASIHRELDSSRGTGFSGFVGRTTHLQVSGMPLQGLLWMAHRDEPFFPIVGIPYSIGDVEFSIEAHASSEDEERFEHRTPAAQQKARTHMLEALLADRFKLRMHWEMRAQTVMRLSAPRGDAKLHRSAGAADPGEMRFNIRSRPNGGMEIVASHAPISALVDFLRVAFRTTVEDATGLQGEYDFVLPYQMGDDDSDPGLPLPLTRALHESLGLDLKPARGESRDLVVDHVEMLTEN